MAIETEIFTQVDFSGGQINESASRRDDLPIVQTGGLKMGNFRAEAQGTGLSRPGRDAIYQGAQRTEFCRMSGVNTYHINFYPGEVQITDTLGNVVFTSTSASYLWTNATLPSISFQQALYQCCICFPGMQPQMLSWAPNTATWTIAPFAWAVIGGNRQEPFFRFNALGASMSWSAAHGGYDTVGASITLTCSANYFTAAMVTAGAVLSILGGQVQITAVASPTVATALILSRLPDSVTFAGVNPTGFIPGQVAASTNSGLKFEVITVGSTTVTGPLMSGRILTTVNAGVADTVSSPAASSATSGFSLYTGTSATVQWQEEFMSAISGWPSACFYGNSRLGFCAFPQRQEAILWGAISSVTATIFYIDSLAATTDATAGALPTAAILEFINGRPKVLNVVDTGDEFVFTDHGVFYIPISPAVGGGALAPGSVQFRQITNDGCSPVRPIALLQSVIYASAGGNRISVVRATGSYTLPYSSDDITDVHSNMFNAPRVIAVSAGDAEPERLCYVVNGDMSLVVGKFSRTTGIVGWHPEPAVGLTSWVTTDLATVFYNSIYAGGNVMEMENPADFLDSTIFVNAPPANMVVGAMGPFWWLANGTVTLAENGVDLGDRSIDGSGNIIQLQGDVLTDATLIGGAPVTKSFQPVIRQASGGQSKGQRMRRRKITQAMLTVEANCELDWGTRRYPAYKWGDDATKPPVMARNSHKAKPAGRRYEPSIAMSSLRYGQIRLIDCDIEVSI